MAGHLATTSTAGIQRRCPARRLLPGTRLERIPEERLDGVRDAYTRDSPSWASFTPVILPGHDDHKPDKTRKLILKALAHPALISPANSSGARLAVPEVVQRPQVRPR